MSEQEQGLMRQLEVKERSSSEDFLFLYLKTQQEKIDNKTIRKESTIGQK
jgi:hypothetical protein